MDGRRSLRAALTGALIGAMLLGACATPSAAPISTPPPAWWSNPPPSRETLYFPGDATGAGDEGMARDLAYQKALTQLTTYLGATVDSRFFSREWDKNGTSDQEVQLEVTVSGVPRTLRQLRVHKVETRVTAGGFDGYVLLAWPRAEYEASLAAERNQAEAALREYLDAERNYQARAFDDAKRSVGAARAALGPPATPVPLSHPTIKDTALLRGALDALEAKLRDAEGAAAKVCALGLRCLKDGAPTPCQMSRVGVVRDAIVRGGRQVAPDALPDVLLGALLDARAVRVEDARQAGRCLVAVQLTSELLEAGKPFTFVRTGARAVLYDSAAGKITWSDEIAPKKVGHVSYDGAMNKGFDELEKAVATRVATAVGGR